MTRCLAFYQKWMQDEGFCEKAATSLVYINKYYEFVEKLVEANADRDQVLLKLPEGAIRNIMGFRADKLKDILPKIVVLVNDENVKKITGSNIDDIVTGYTPKVKMKITNVIPVTNVITPPIAPVTPHVATVAPETKTQQIETIRKKIVELKNDIEKKSNELKHLRNLKKTAEMQLRHLKDSKQSELPPDPVTLAEKMNGDDYAEQVKI